MAYKTVTIEVKERVQGKPLPNVLLDAEAKIRVKKNAKWLTFFFCTDIRKHPELSFAVLFFWRKVSFFGKSDTKKYSSSSLTCNIFVDSQDTK